MRLIKNANTIWNPGPEQGPGLLRFWIPALLWCVSAGWMGSCKPDQEKIVQDKVNERIADFVKKKKAECRASLLTEAERLVDSILLADARAELRDSLQRTKPFAPQQPPEVPPIDTLEVKPVFEKQR